MILDGIEVIERPDLIDGERKRSQHVYNMAQIILRSGSEEEVDAYLCAHKPGVCALISAEGYAEGWRAALWSKEND